MALKDDDASSGVVDPRLVIGLAPNKLDSEVSAGSKSKKACSNCGHVSRSRKKKDEDQKKSSKLRKHEAGFRETQRGPNSPVGSVSSGMVDALGPPVNEQERLRRNAANDAAAPANSTANDPRPPPAGPPPSPVTEEWRRKRAALLLWEYRQEMKKAAEEKAKLEREAMEAWEAERIKPPHEINYWKAPRLGTGKPDIHPMRLDEMNPSVTEILRGLMNTVDFEAAFNADNDWVGPERNALDYYNVPLLNKPEPAAVTPATPATSAAVQAAIPAVFPAATPAAVENPAATPAAKPAGEENAAVHNDSRIANGWGEIPASDNWGGVMDKNDNVAGPAWPSFRKIEKSQAGSKAKDAAIKSKPGSSKRSGGLTMENIARLPSPDPLSKVDAWADPMADIEMLGDRTAKSKAASSKGKARAAGKDDTTRLTVNGKKSQHEGDVKLPGPALPLNSPLFGAYPGSIRPLEDWDRTAKSQKGAADAGWPDQKDGAWDGPAKKPKSQARTGNTGKNSSKDTLPRARAHGSAGLPAKSSSAGHPNDRAGWEYKAGSAVPGGWPSLSVRSGQPYPMPPPGSPFPPAPYGFPPGYSPVVRPAGGTPVASIYSLRPPAPSMPGNTPAASAYSVRPPGPAAAAAPPSPFAFGGDATTGRFGFGGPASNKSFNPIAKGKSKTNAKGLDGASEAKSKSSKEAELKQGSVKDVKKAEVKKADGSAVGSVSKLKEDPVEDGPTANGGVWTTSVGKRAQKRKKKGKKA